MKPADSTAASEVTVEKPATSEVTVEKFEPASADGTDSAADSNNAPNSESPQSEPQVQDQKVEAFPFHLKHIPDIKIAWEKRGMNIKLVCKRST